MSLQFPSFLRERCFLPATGVAVAAMLVFLPINSSSSSLPLSVIGYFLWFLLYLEEEKL